MNKKRHTSIHGIILAVSLLLAGVASASAAQSSESPAYQIDDDEYFAVGAEYTGRNFTGGKVMGVFTPHFAAFYNLRNNPNFQEALDGSIRLKEGAQPRMLVVLPPKDARFSRDYAYKRDFSPWAASLADPRVNAKINTLLVEEAFKYEEIFGQKIQTKDIEYLYGGEDFGLLYHENLNPKVDSLTGESAPPRSSYQDCGRFEQLIDGYDLVVAPFVCIADERAVIVDDALTSRAEWPVDRYFSREKLHERAVYELQKEVDDYQQALDQAPETLSLLEINNYRQPGKARLADGSENRGTLCSVSGVDPLDMDVATLYQFQRHGQAFPTAVFDDLDQLFMDLQARESSCRYLVLPVKQKEILKEALDRKNIGYSLPHHIYRFDSAFDILAAYFEHLEIGSRDEYLFYRDLGFDEKVIAAFRSEGVTTHARHAEFKRRYEAEFPQTDLGTVEGMLRAISVKQEAEANGQSIAAFLSAEQEAEAARREQQRVAAAERAARRQATEKEKAKEYPYYAEVSCGITGTTVDVRACFIDTTLTVSMNNHTREKKSWQLQDLGHMRGDVLVIDLREQFFIKAQNSHETLGITIAIKDRLTKRTIASDQAGDLYKVAVIRR